MRAISGGERSAIAGDVRVVHRLRIHNASGTWKELTSLGGMNYLTRASWGTDIDAPTWTATFELKARVDTNSISPFVTGSPHNVDDLGAYAPLLDIGRRIEWYTSLVALGGTPVAGDERLVFTGYVSAVQIGRDGVGKTISLVCSDLGWPLVNAQIEDEREYGSAVGVALEAVIQSILDDNLGAGVYTLVTPVSPSWLLRPFPQKRVKVMEAIRALAAQIGWDVRFMWTGAVGTAGSMELRLFEPDRAKTISDAVFGPGEYFPIDNFAVDSADIRNAGRVFYTHRDTHVRASAYQEHLGSIAQLGGNPIGRRYLEIGLAASNIDTPAEAQDMIDAAIHDLALPKADQGNRVGYFWPAECGDLYTFNADGDTYDTAQQLAVTRVSHSLDGSGKFPSTTLDLRGTVAGAYRAWLDKEGLAPQPVPPTPDPYNTDIRSDPAGFGGTLGSGLAMLVFVMREGLAEVEVYTVEGPAIPFDPPSIDATRLSTICRRPEGLVGRGVVQAFYIAVETTPGWYRRFALVGVDYFGRRSTPFITDENFAGAACVDIAPTMTLGGITGFSVTRNGTANRITWTPLAPTNPFNPASAVGTMIVRDGVILTVVFPAPLTPGPGYDYGVSMFWDDFDISPDKRYAYQVFQWDPATGKTSAIGAQDSAAPPADIQWANNTPAQNITGGVPRAKYDWTSSGVVGAVDLLIEKSQDGGVSEPWATIARVAWAASGSYLDPDHSQRTYIRFRAVDGSGVTVAFSDVKWWNGFFTPGLVPILPYIAPSF